MRAVRTRLVVATATVAALVLVGAAPASAHKSPPPPAPPTPVTLLEGLVGPLSLASDGRSVYVTDNFAGLLLKKQPNRDPRVLYADAEGAEVGGVSVADGKVVFTRTLNQGAPDAVGEVLQLRKDGTTKLLADLAGYEATVNPDAAVSYGFVDFPDELLSEWPTDVIGPPTYTGIIDSHPYATAQKRDMVYVADAAANAVLAVRNGKVSTVAVLPPTEIVITPSFKVALEEAINAGGPDGPPPTPITLPDGIIGLTYRFESVPTDVEIGPGGVLYVTTLGGIAGELGPYGSVYKVDPRGRSTKVTLVSSGFVGATNVAVSPTGELFVANLFGGSIAKVGRGGVTTFAELPLPAAVEWTPRGLLATMNALPGGDGPPAGAVVQLELGRHAKYGKSKWSHRHGWFEGFGKLEHHASR